MRFVASVNLIIEAEDLSSAEASAVALLEGLSAVETQLIEVFDPQT